MRETNRAYYDAIQPSDLCGCAYCRNYSHEIARTYPQLQAYLEDMGIDIAKPFETMPLEPDADGWIDYIGAQYIVLGDGQAFQKTCIAGVTVDITTSHPDTNLTEPHIVIELYPLRLRWVMGQL